MVRGSRRGEDGGTDTDSTSVPVGFGVPFPPCPRAVLGLWSQVPTGFDFPRERPRERDQELRGKLRV